MMTPRPRGRALLLLLMVSTLFIAWPSMSLADDPPPPETDTEASSGLPEILESSAFDQNLGDAIPLDLAFTDETGRHVTLADYAGEKPILLTMNYYTCNSLCPIMLDSVARGLKPIPYTMGQDFEMVTVSIDPSETPEDAAAVKRKLVDMYQRDGSAEAWHLLTGDQASIEQLAEAVGFNFTWDEQTQQYAHPSGVMFLTAEGVIARYIYGIEFNPRDLRFALVETSDRRIGTPVDQVLLFCYRYDPTIGSYGTIAINTMRLGGTITILVLGGALFWMLRQERRESEESASTAQHSQTTV